MFHALRDRVRRARHAWTCREVWSTAPMAAGDGRSGLALVTQLGRRELLMYLVAAKSALRALGPAQVVQLDDGSLQDRDRAALARHLPGSHCMPIAAVETGPCPRGGTWERLCHILERAATSYVIQLDADTLALDGLQMVRDCIAANRPFALGTRLGRAPVRLTEAARHAPPRGTHVQYAAEHVLAALPDAGESFYVRGSSGFAGFARGGFARAKLDIFSRQMEAALGRRWHEWGTEQVASNFAIANSPGAVVLPYPEYACFDPQVDPRRARFLHFIGTHRFVGGTYGACSRAVLASLSGGVTPTVR